jgi:hypothetical protein
LRKEEEKRGEAGSRGGGAHLARREEGRINGSVAGANTKCSELRERQEDSASSELDVASGGQPLFLPGEEASKLWVSS